MEITCYPYHTMTGTVKSKFKCTDGVWDSNLPTCELDDGLCTEPPPQYRDQSQLIKLKSTRLVHEYGEEYTKTNMTIYRSASYLCPQIGRFFNTKVKKRFVENRSEPIYYVDTNCVGKNKWEEIDCS